MAPGAVVNQIFRGRMWGWQWRGESFGSGSVGVVGPGEFGDDAEVAEISDGDVPVILRGKIGDLLGAFVFRQIGPAGVEGFPVNAAARALLQRGADGGLKMQDGPIHWPGSSP